jgi:murein DD-endopeptidase MepM/ murein hydrolase activator NlpD
VACGQSVFQGDVIGALGSTGNSSGPHLHFELRSDEYGRVDPNQFLPPP